MADDAVVYVVDDDEAVRKSMRRLIAQVDLSIRTFASAAEFLRAYSPIGPSCLVLDVRMPGMSGVDLQKKLIQEGVEVPIIIVTGHGDIPMAVDAMRRGAVDFLEKPFRAQALLDSIHRALDHDRKNRLRKQEAEALHARFAHLTPREWEVVDQVVVGRTNKEIAVGLGVSPQAIDARRANAMSKLGVETVPELVEAVLRYRWNASGRETNPPPPAPVGEVALEPRPGPEPPSGGGSPA